MDVYLLVFMFVYQTYKHFSSTVLNNEDEDAPDPYNPSSIFKALRARRWVITADEQVSELFFLEYYNNLLFDNGSIPMLTSLKFSKMTQIPPFNM